MRGPCERGVCTEGKTVGFLQLPSLLLTTLQCYYIATTLLLHCLNIATTLLLHCLYIATTSVLHCFDASTHLPACRLVPSKPWNVTLFPLRMMSTRKSFEEAKSITTVNSKQLSKDTKHQSDPMFSIWKSTKRLEQCAGVCRQMCQSVRTNIVVFAKKYSSLCGQI